MSPKEVDPNGNLIAPTEGLVVRPKYHYVADGTFSIVVQNALFFVVGQLLWLGSFSCLLQSSIATLIWSKCYLITDFVKR